MGLLSGLMGNASEVDARKLQAELAQVLASSERVEKAYQLIRDMFVFTDKRLIVVNRQGLTGSGYQSFPYLMRQHTDLWQALHTAPDPELGSSRRRRARQEVATI